MKIDGRFVISSQLNCVTLADRRMSRHRGELADVVGAVSPHSDFHAGEERRSRQLRAPSADAHV